MNRISIFVSALAIVFVLAQPQETQAQPVPVPAVQAAPLPVPNGPLIGIIVEPFRMNTPNGMIVGVKVLADTKQRPLFAPAPNGGWQRFKFRPGADVILEVNGTVVKNAAGVSGAVGTGWNTLKVWDTNTGKTGEYQVNLK